MKSLIVSLCLISSMNVYSMDYSKFTFLGSLDAGVGMQKSKDSVEDNNQTGSYIGGKLVSSYDTQSFKYDLGLGWFHYKVKTDLTQGIYSAVYLRTQAPVLHFSPKYKVNDNFLVGVEGNYVFDNGVMISPSAYSKIMVGVNATYVKPLSEKYEMRVVASVSRTMDFSNKDLTLGMLSLQLGYKSQSTEVKPLKNNQVSLGKGIVHTKRVITKVTLDETLIHFETNSYDLTMKSQALLTELAAFLASNPDMWQGLEIEGHTDLRGGEEYNTILSVKRANSVYKTMREVEMPNDRIIFLGKGKNVPFDTTISDESFAKNRRVELKFIDVSDKEKLMNFIETLKKKYQK